MANNDTEIVDIDGQRLKLTNLDKVMYPATGTTKAEVIHYYATIADVTRLGGSVVQEPARVPGVAFALIADPAGQVVGLAQQG